MGDGPNDTRPLGAPHPPRVRREPAPPADRPHRSLPDAPRRSRARRGTRSGRRWSCSSQQGKVLYVGSSNFAGWHIAQASDAAASRHFLGLVSEQSLYNLIARTIELEVIPACRALRARRHPVEPARAAACSAARSASRRRAGARPSGSRKAIEKQPRQARGVRGALPRARRGAGRRRARVAPAPSRRHARRSSARARWSSSAASLRAVELTLDQLDPRAPRSHLARAGRRGPRGLRLVRRRR